MDKLDEKYNDEYAGHSYRPEEHMMSSCVDTELAVLSQTMMDIDPVKYSYLKNIDYSMMVPGSVVVVNDECTIKVIKSVDATGSLVMNDGTLLNINDVSPAPNHLMRLKKDMADIYTVFFKRLNERWSHDHSTALVAFCEYYSIPYEEAMGLLPIAYKRKLLEELGIDPSNSKIQNILNRNNPIF